MPPKKPRLPKERNVIQQVLVERGSAGAGNHKNKQNYDRGHARQPKHKGLEREAGQELLPYERALAESSKTASNTRKKACGEGCGCGCGGGKPADHHPEGGSYMSTQALRGMIDHASDLLEGIDNSTPLPDWVEAKLTRAALNLEDVYEYLAHGHGKKTAAKQGQYEGYFDPVQDYPQLYKELRSSRVSWSAFFGALEDYVLNNGDAFSAVRDLKLKLSPRADEEVEELGSAIEDLHFHGRKANQKLLPGQFHVEYPHSRILRLLVYAPGHSTFFEARANASAPKVLAQKLADVGFFVTEEQMEEAIEKA